MATMQVRGVELYYETAGSGEPVLLLHGLGSSTRDWELQLPAWSGQYQVVMVDVRGHGRSAKRPGPYTVPQFASDIATFIDALGLTPVRVLGLSMGGMIAFQLALDRPDLCRSLVIVNSYPGIEFRTWSQRFFLWQRLIILRLTSMRRTGEFIGKRMFPKPEQAELRQEIARRWMDNDKTAYLATLKGLLNWNVIARLGEIACPVLVISGDRDYVPVADKEAFTAQMPHARLLVVPDSGHATPVDQAEVFNTAVLHFWDQEG